MGVLTQSIIFISFKGPVTATGKFNKNSLFRPVSGHAILVYIGPNYRTRNNFCSRSNYDGMSKHTYNWVFCLLVKPKYDENGIWEY